MNTDVSRARITSVEMLPEKYVIAAGRYAPDISLETDNVTALFNGDFIPIGSDDDIDDDNGTIMINSFRGVNWFRVSIAHILEMSRMSPHNRNHVLMLSNPHLKRVDLFAPDEWESGSYALKASWGDIRTGEVVPNSRPAFIMPYFDASWEDYFIYMRVENDMPIGMQMYLMEQSNYIESYTTDILKGMVLLLFLIVFSLTYLLFYLTTNKSLYLMTAVGETAGLIFVASFNGYMSVYFGVPRAVSDVAAWVAYGVVFVVWGLLIRLAVKMYDEDSGAEAACTRAFDALTAIEFALAAAMTALQITKMTDHLLFTGVAMIVLDLTAAVYAALRMRGSPVRALLFAAWNALFAAGITAMLTGSFMAIQETRYLSSLSAIIFIFLMMTSALTPFCEARKRFSNYSQLQEQSMYYRALSQRDTLTDLYNRAFMSRALDIAIRESHKKKIPISFLMMDIDHFKNFNDTWGHQEGDRALVLVANTLKDSLRSRDVPARYGGEEFCAVLYNVRLETAEMIAERIRVLCAGESHSLGEGKNITISLGVAMYDESAQHCEFSGDTQSGLHGEDTQEALIKRADTALYAAKNGGRNCTFSMAGDGTLKRADMNNT